MLLLGGRMYACRASHVWSMRMLPWRVRCTHDRSDACGRSESARGGGPDERRSGAQVLHPDRRAIVVRAHALLWAQSSAMRREAGVQHEATPWCCDVTV